MRSMQADALLLLNAYGVNEQVWEACFPVEVNEWL